MHKRSLLLFSGGLDSSYVLYNHARLGEGCDLLYIDGGQAAGKIEMERIHRDKILDYLYAEYRVTYTDHIVNGPNLAGGKSIAWSQPFPWLYGALFKVDPDVHSSVEISYVMGDEMSTHIDNLVAAWNALWPVVKIGPVVPLTFPLRYRSKSTILRDIPEKLYRLTWVCEAPKEKKPCHNCAACITRKTEEFRYELIYNRALTWFQPSSESDVQEEKTVLLPGLEKVAPDRSEISSSKLRKFLEEKETEQ